MLAVLLRFQHLPLGLPQQQMCGCISLWEEGKLCKEMQQQWGKLVLDEFEET